MFDDDFRHMNIFIAPVSSNSRDSNWIPRLNSAFLGITHMFEALFLWCQSLETMMMLVQSYWFLETSWHLN
ncbi:hypothetical protein AKJ16_DCAP25865 [Drosera capensis]